METQSTQYFSALNMLVKPADEESTGGLNDILQLNIAQALDKLGVGDISYLQTLRRVSCHVTEDSSVRWRFVCTTLHILLSLTEDLEKAALLSISQQKSVKTCLQFVVSMGLLPSLLPGVGISLASRCTNVNKLKDEDLVILEKYERLAGVARALLVCCEQQALRSVVLEEHLGDMMAALSQLSFAPLKKPPEQKPEPGADFLMTEELWAKLQDDRNHFKSYYLTFVAQVYQPLVIKQLLLLQGAPGSKIQPPGWLKRACIQLLVQCLMRSGGVSNMVRSICQLSSLDIAEEWEKLDTVVRLITTTHSLQEDVYYKCIGRQMIEMLSVPEELLNRVAVLCIKSLSENKPAMCRRYLLHVVMAPLLLCTYNPQEGPQPPPASASHLSLFTGPGSHMVVRIHSASVLATEEQLTQCILNLHKCFVSASNALAPELLWLVAQVLFRLHQKVYKSALHLKTYVQDLLLLFMRNCVQDKLHQAFGAFLFGDVVTGMVAFSQHVELEFAAGGGVQVALRDQPANRDTRWSEEAGHCLLQLLEQGDKVGDMTNILFVSLLHMLSDRNDNFLLHDGLNDLEDDIEECMMGTTKNLLTIKFLIILAGNSAVQERLHAEPGPIIRFIRFLLEREANRLSEKSDGDDERLYTITMILSILLSSNETHWPAYQPLQGPLKVLAEELKEGDTRDLASQLYNKIASHGLVNEATPSTKQVLGDEAKGKKGRGEEGRRFVTVEGSACKMALAGVSDASIPVRGHALLTLAKLINSGDQEAQRNRNQILRIFQENLRHEDSYIYLSCINGLGVMAAVFPNTVVQTLVEELATLSARSSSNVDPAELIMKIGEVLVRVTKQLGDFVPAYKSMLLNAFLSGTRDVDPLVRASSLSNLGQVCQALGFRVGSVVSEILTCVGSLVQSDKSVIVRRAAILVITLLLQGLGSDTQQVLGRVLLSLYRTLKTIYQTEPDDIIKLHCQLALEELNKSTLAFLFPRRKLEKQLFVLTPPPLQ